MLIKELVREDLYKGRYKETGINLGIKIEDTNEMFLNSLAGVLFLSLREGEYNAN